MSIDFSTLQGLTIPEGVVTQIADASGRVIWAVQSGGKVVLEVEKITSDTYVSSISRTGEQFILLDIYPKTANSTVKVTYGGLTKTLTFSGTNAQQVYFGVFGGVTDSVTTPASGDLTIVGDCIGVACGTFNSAKSTTKICSAIKTVKEWGGITLIPNNMYTDTMLFSHIEIPEGVTNIGDNAFYNKETIESVKLPNSLANIGASAFKSCISLVVTEIPEGVTNIGNNAFGMPYTEDDQGSIIPNTPMSRGTLTLPSTIINIGSNAFCYEYNSKYGAYLTNLIILATTPPTISGASPATNCIIVPKGCGDTYKAAEGWSNYANYITEAS